nr:MULTISPECIES: DNA primase family protein [unclassified Bradyrhizobium]
MAATRVAAGSYGVRWNWRIEERNIRRDCEGWIKKHPPEEKKIKAAERAGVERRERLTVIDGGASKPQTDGANALMPAIIKKAEEHITLGKAVLAHIRANGEALINTKHGAWFYSGGVWERRVENQWLNVRIEHICAGFSFKSGSKLINETRNWIERQPELWRDGDLPWDQHGKIPTRSGLIDPKSGALEPARPDHFCTWRVEVDYDPEARCPWWQTMLADMFGDRADHERDALVGVVQELVGCSLIDKKPRALSKACVFWGIENRAKSGVLDVVTGLFGNNPIGAGIGNIEGTHGLMPFQRRAPWVLHEAFGGQWHFSATVKSIITQEPVMINIKNGPMPTQIVRSPIFWATNFQPQFKEATKAIVSRMIVIEVTRAFVEAAPIGAAAEAIRRGFSKPGEFVVATELPGVLNWAIGGLQRALARGSIASTDSIAATAKAIHQDSNLVAGFLEECVEFDPMARLKTADFCLAHSAWWMELKGEDRRLPSNEAIGKALRAIGDPRVCTHRDDMRDGTGRYYSGIALKKAGLAYHKIAYESRLFEGKVGKATDPQREVNSLIPATWDTRESVIKMREHHAERVTNDRNDGGQEAPGH